uniref:Sperm tail PG-rich repeat containing 2 n=1 Tax=Leptobrachium leishanense TaxID=445787 RepID=A0A8C5MK18_9ANUR
MYDRATRTLAETLGSTQENVGPGSYDLSGEKMYKTDGYAPFLSLAKRDFGFNVQQTISAAPGPGHYNISTIKDTVKGGHTMKSTEARFKEPASTVPGPGEYELASKDREMFKINRVASPSKQQMRILSHVKKHYKPAPPSIPTPGQAFGYEEAEDGSLVRQLPPKTDDSLGPAYYDEPTSKYAFATLKYKGVHFGKYSGKRTEFEKKEGPGPGEYDLDQESALHYENVNSKKEDKKKYEPFIPRYHEVIALQEEKKGVPGPGNYEIVRHFEKGQTLTKSANIPCPPFLSNAERFLPVKSITPAPGTYNEQRTAFESLKKISSMAQKPFGQTAVRFTQEPRLQQIPGPGSYDIFSHGFVREITKKASYENTCKGGFGSSANRALSILKGDAILTPGPAHYMVKDKIDEPYKHQTSSVFSSGTERLSSQIEAKDSPPPGSYNICKSFEILHSKKRYRPPRTRQAKIKHNSFLSSSPRGLAMKSDFKVPGPGAYNPVISTSQSLFSLSKEERFKELKENTPGPGTYKVHM